mmetsp:Transcript_2464/g.8864  ORF Transcript_2464/g.8864 Transcript_2464/m.8864 type:complete len:326 (+) Transcript_2464:3359-4336(+)
MYLEEGGEEEGQILQEGLLIVGAVGVGLRQVGALGEHGAQLLHEVGVQLEEVLVVEGAHVEAPDLGEALQAHIAQHWGRDQLEQRLHQRALEDVPQGDPAEEGVQRRQRGLHQLHALRARQHKLAELVDQRELRVERLLELRDLGLRHLPPGEVEHLLRQQLEDHHAVLTQRLRGLGGAHQVRDEGLPLGGPLVLEHLHQDDVQLVDEHLLRPKQRLVRAQLDDQVRHVVLDAVALLRREDVPPELDLRLEDLQGEELGVLHLRALQDGVHAHPRVWVLLHLLEHLLRRRALIGVLRRVEGVHRTVQKLDVQRLVEVQDPVRHGS